MCVCELMPLLECSQANVSAHLRALRQAGLVQPEKIGRWAFYRLDVEAVEGLARWLAERLGQATMAPSPDLSVLHLVCLSGEAPRSRTESAAQKPRCP